MSPAAREAAEKLGYTNVKVYHDGMPEWVKRNALALTPKFLKETWFDKQNPIVVVDARAAAVAKEGFIKGAVTIESVNDAALKALPEKKMKAPLLVYDEDGRGNAGAVAKSLVTAGYTNTRVLTGGIAAWKAAGYPVEKGQLAVKASYVPKPKPGEISIDEFQKIIASNPADTIVLDVRGSDEVKEGAFKGSVNIPVESLAERAGELPKDKRIVIHCSSGTRAEMAYHTLKPKGFTKMGFLNAKVFFDEGKAEITK